MTQHVQKSSSFWDYLPFGSSPKKEETPEIAVPKPQPITFERPTLTPPEQAKTAFAGMLSLVEDMEVSYDLARKFNVKRLQEVTTALLEAQEAYMNKILESGQEFANSSTWSRLQNVASCLFASGSIVLGMSLISQGEIYAGSLLLGSGATNIASHLLAGTNVDWKIRAALGLASGVMGIAGGSAGYQHLIGRDPQDLVNLGLSLLNTAFSLASAAIQYKKGRSDSQLKYIESEKIQVETRIQEENISIDEITNDNKKLAELFKFPESVSKSLADYHDSMKKILRG